MAEPKARAQLLRGRRAAQVEFERPVPAASRHAEGDDVMVLDIRRALRWPAPGEGTRARAKEQWLSIDLARDKARVRELAEADRRVQAVRRKVDPLIGQAKIRAELGVTLQQPADDRYDDFAAVADGRADAQDARGMGRADVGTFFERGDLGKYLAATPVELFAIC